MRRRITVIPGRGATINGLPSKVSRFNPPYSIIVSGEFEFEIEDLDPYVTVQILDVGTRWTYRDPSGTLRVGDLVEVPYGYNDSPKIAKVVSQEKEYDGPLQIKDVTAKLNKLELL